MSLLAMHVFCIAVKLSLRYILLHFVTYSHIFVDFLASQKEGQRIALPCHNAREKNANLKNAQPLATEIASATACLCMRTCDVSLSFSMGFAESVSTETLWVYPPPAITYGGTILLFQGTHPVTLRLRAGSCCFCFYSCSWSYSYAMELFYHGPTMYRAACNACHSQCSIHTSPNRIYPGP